MRNKAEVTLLLVEDDDVDAMAVERSFAKCHIGNPLVRANDGLDALEKVRSGQVPRPFVVLLDLQMPRMNGLEFLEAVRQDPALADLVIFVLTTSKAEEDMTAAYQKQIAGYFVKEDRGRGFLNVIQLLDEYWNIVYLRR